MTIESAKEKIRALLEKKGFTEQTMKEGLFVLISGSAKVGVELFGKKPTVGVFLNNKLEEEGHGISRIQDLRNEVMNIWEKEVKVGVRIDETKPTPKSESNELPGNVPDSSTLGMIKKPKPTEVVKPKGEVNKMNDDAKNDLIHEAMNPRPKEVEIVKDNLPARKTEFKTGTCEAVAIQYGIPSELANLFFMKMNEGLYIKNPGLLYLAGKKGYSRIEITDSYDKESQEWSAECRIYPKVSKEILEGISKLDKEMQKQAFDFLTNPTNGTGRASKNNVKMSTMQAFLREMAQTRAQNRALRAFTGYGGTSAEELPEGQIEDTK